MYWIFAKTPYSCVHGNWGFDQRRSKRGKGKKELVSIGMFGENTTIGDFRFVLFAIPQLVSHSFQRSINLSTKKRFLFSRFWYTMDDRWRIRKFTEKRSRKRELRTSMTMNEENRFIWRLLYNAVQSMKFMHVLNKTN